MASVPFIKMHGLGNDFVIFNSGDLPEGSTYLDIVKLADRRLGIGCDQVILLNHSDKADIAMRIFNADGQEAGACGNASRCAGWLMMQESGGTESTIETNYGILSCTLADTGNGYDVTVDMGAPRLEWQDIPLSRKQDTLQFDLKTDSLKNPVAVNMGNPHAVFFVDDVEDTELDKWGAELEHDPLFPEGANISAVQVMGDKSLRMKVWERGAGLTPACGTAACAALVAAVRRELLAGRNATVELPGGELNINWQEENLGGHVFMSGPVAVSFHGSFEVDDYGRG